MLTAKKCRLVGHFRLRGLPANPHCLFLEARQSMKRIQKIYFYTLRQIGSNCNCKYKHSCSRECIHRALYPVSIFHHHDIEAYNRRYDISNRYTVTIFATVIRAFRKTRKSPSNKEMPKWQRKPRICHRGAVGTTNSSS